MREGMSWIVPVPLLSLLTAKQLEQMVCGMPEICCDVLKKVVRYREVDEQHSLVQWFWQTLEEFSNEERVLFMRFVSGRSRLPANTADISQRFQIMKVDRVSRAVHCHHEKMPNYFIGNELSRENNFSLDEAVQRQRTSVYVYLGAFWFFCSPIFNGPLRNSGHY